MLGRDEVAFLTAHLDRVCRWDSRAVARIRVRGSSLGVFTAPPTGCLAFVAVPLAAPPPEVPGATQIRALGTWPGEDADPWDRVVPALRLRESLAHARGPGSQAHVPVPATDGMYSALAMLPPWDGWQPPVTGVARDVLPLVQRAVDEFRRDSAGLDADAQTALAERIWDRSVWGGLPVRVLHTARLLGLVADEPARIAASTCGSWKRLSTRRGQVFHHRDGAHARLSLSVVR